MSRKLPVKISLIDLGRLCLLLVGPPKRRHTLASVFKRMFSAAEIVRFVSLGVSVLQEVRRLDGRLGSFFTGLESMLEEMSSALYSA